MNQQDFLSKIEGILNDLSDHAGIMTKDEAKNALLETFLYALDPFVKARSHLQLFMYRVHTMREWQKAWFKGDRSVLKDAKKSEVAVDNAINKLLTDFGYKMEDISKKVEQTKLL